MSNTLRYLTELNEYTPLRTSVLGNLSCAVFGVDDHKPYFLSQLCKDTDKKFFIIVPDEKQARITYQFLQNNVDGTYFLPIRDYSFRNLESISKFSETTRIETILHIKNGDYRCIVAPAEALCFPVSAQTEEREFTITLDTTESPEDLAEKLVSLGYAKYEQVDGPGQFSLRGGLVDIFSPAHDTPVRIEFFGDEIDTIYAFDLETQRRTERLDTVKISPAIEFDALFAERLLKELPEYEENDFVRKDLSLLRSGILPKHDRYLPLYFQSSSCVLDHITKDTTVVFFEHTSCLQGINGFIARLEEDMRSSVEDGYFFFEGRYAYSDKDILERIEKPIIFNTFPTSVHEFKLDTLLEIKIFPTSIGSFDLLEEEVSGLLDEGYEISVLSMNENHASDLQTGFKHHRNLHIEKDSLPFGFLLPTVKKAVYSYRQKSIEEIKKKHKRFKQGEKIRHFSDISKGDYVVHENYGIGIYDGIHKVESLGVINDYIKLKFAGTDVLYFPCSQLDQISKYTVGSETPTVKLNKLGGNEWERTKQRVRHSVKDLAAQLIALYGKRLNSKGHAYSEDTEWQRDFEADFPFEETEDQIRSIAEIKQDMEKPFPMDRLLCGDVGFGKTEVALRAVFKAVMDGKQVAVLAPTTLLALQHFHTITERFKNFPIKVELLSRMRTPTQQKKILSAVKSGVIDVLVGTHRILQKDLVFKNLGFIVVDEEQRFGVAHKEHLKEIAPDADVLTLSATPIPRTLNMSMSGIRDISILNDPPQNRYPVTTYVAEYDLGLITDAIKREVSRGGQCFYLHNRIETIYKVASTLYDRTGYRIQVAHGKMSQDEISSIWEALVKHEIDVLVCTTIIETGVDVPNCNTLIIEDADRLGLAQLHQIRGRVGRSDRRAFAYFMFRKGKTLSEDAYKRLMTIKEFTEFGSGLKIAMRDMEIRGAGNVLGAEQSGHMLSVGYDMYMKLLEEAVNDQQGTKENKITCAVDIKISAYIPDTFIRNSETRIEIYKKIASVSDDEMYTDLLDEIIDRFGDPPKAVENLLSIAKIKEQAASLGFSKIEQRQNGLLFYPANEPSLDLIAEISSHYRRKLFYTPGQKPYYTLKFDNVLADLNQFLEIYKNSIDTVKQ